MLNTSRDGAAQPPQRCQELCAVGLVLVAPGAGKGALALEEREAELAKTPPFPGLARA